MSENTEKKFSLTLVEPCFPLKDENLELTEEERVSYALEHLDQALMYCMELKSLKGQQVADRIYNAFTLAEKLQSVQYT